MTDKITAHEACKDNGTIRLGAGMRRTAPAAEPISLAAVADTGRIRLGAGMRIPSRRR